MSLKTPLKSQNPFFKQEPSNYDLSFSAYKSYASLIQPNDDADQQNIQGEYQSHKADFFDWSLVETQE